MNKNIIRVGDRVKIVVPSIMLRVGYPKTVGDYEQAAKEAYGAQLWRDMSGRCAELAIRQIAYGLAKKDGFGGRARTMHLREVPELLGREFTVHSMRTVQTGTYYKPRSSGDGEDWEPGGLDDRQDHRLASGWGWCGKNMSEWIPVKHLLKLDVNQLTEPKER
jgi:hypothetical protein